MNEKEIIVNIVFWGLVGFFVLRRRSRKAKEGREEEKRLQEEERQKRDSQKKAAEARKIAASKAAERAKTLSARYSKRLAFCKTSCKAKLIRTPTVKSI